LLCCKHLITSIRIIPKLEETCIPEGSMGLEKMMRMN